MNNKTLEFIILLLALLVAIISSYLKNWIAVMGWVCVMFSQLTSLFENKE